MRQIQWKMDTLQQIILNTTWVVLQKDFVENAMWVECSYHKDSV